MKRITTYKNGNVIVTIFDDGTRICDSNSDTFEYEFPLSMDCKITNQCPYGCKMCHEQSTPDGAHGDIMNIEFINKLHAGTEIAIGGGAVTTHPDLVPFLEKLKSIGVLPSITVNQREYEQHEELINYLIDNKLIYGLGISFMYKNDEFWDRALKYKSAVVHIIAGLINEDNLNYLASKQAKILILGYKNFGRGKELLQKMPTEINSKIDWLKNNLSNYLNRFKVVSFDNLSLKQLEVQNLLSKEQWDEFFQGMDGTGTMYVDLVKQEFAKTSTSIERKPITKDIKDMFAVVKEM